jgi:hypothetical protein
MVFGGLIWNSRKQIDNKYSMHNLNIDFKRLNILSIWKLIKLSKKEVTIVIRFKCDFYFKTWIYGKLKLKTYAFKDTNRCELIRQRRLIVCKEENKTLSKQSNK